MDNYHHDQPIGTVSASREVISQPSSGFPELSLGEYIGQVNIAFEYIL